MPSRRAKKGTKAPLDPKWRPAPAALMFQVGLEYYISARSAWHHGHNQVAGNLFHHAIEMMLKGLLFARSVHSPDALRVHKHNVPWFWGETKSKVSVAFDPVRFDDFIADLHRWELVRFGDFPKGISKSLEIVVFRAAMIAPRAQWLDVYRLCLEDVDELFLLLTREMTWNAQFVRDRIRPEGIEDYERLNNYAAT